MKARMLGPTLLNGFLGHSEWQHLLPVAQFVKLAHLLQDLMARGTARKQIPNLRSVASAAVAAILFLAGLTSAQSTAKVCLNDGRLDTRTQNCNCNTVSYSRTTASD